ncbi:MAG: hypothetical protein WBF60_02530, partial [Castellaniella sp.]
MRVLGLGLMVCLVALPASVQASLQTRQAQAQEDRKALREQIETVQKHIDSSKSAREDASRDLKASEQAISDIIRRLVDLAQRHEALDKTLQGLSNARQQQMA